MIVQQHMPRRMAVLAHIWVHTAVSPAMAKPFYSPHITPAMSCRRLFASVTTPGETKDDRNAAATRRVLHVTSISANIKEPGALSTEEGSGSGSSSRGVQDAADAAGRGHAVPDEETESLDVSEAGEEEYCSDGPSEADGGTDGPPDAAPDDPTPAGLSNGGSSGAKTGASAPSEKPGKRKQGPARPRAPLFREEDLREAFVRGGGPGGQAVAKSSNCVVLTHAPTGISVRCHATRSQAENRALARRELNLRLDELQRGRDSYRQQKQRLEGDKEARRHDKTSKKHAWRARLKQLEEAAASTQAAHGTEEGEGPVAAASTATGLKS
jgi:hypothetical protein